jgi:hypothetical protein
MRRCLLALLALGSLAAPAGAQSLSDRFRQLFTFGDCGQPLCLEVEQAVHGDHFIPAAVQGENNMLAFLSTAITSAIGNVPFAAAASGTAFSFEGGAPVAIAISPGPVFADRAQTLGRGQFFVGATVSGINFDNLRGVGLSDLEFNFAHQNLVGDQGDPAMGNPTFENDYIAIETDLSLSLIVGTLVASYGLADRVDIGVAVPIVRASMSGTSQAVFVPWDRAATPHYFGTDTNPEESAMTSTEGTAVGVGDIGARLKVHLYDGASFGISAIGDVRLPTGSEDDFLGSGTTSVRAIAVLSGRFGNFTPHVNAGALLTSSDELNNRLLVTAGFDHLLSESVTLALDLVSNLQMGDSKLTVPDRVVFTAPTVRTLDLTNIPREVDNLMDGSVGVKIGAGGFRIVGNALIPLTEGGMRPGLMWTVGLERTF